MLKITKDEAKVLLQSLSEHGIDLQYSTEEEADKLVKKLEAFVEEEGTFITRMEQESQELFEKLTKLQVFSQTEVFKRLSELNRDLLNMQYCSMYTYHVTLSIRINQAKNGTKNV